MPEFCLFILMDGFPFLVFVQDLWLPSVLV